MFYRKIDEGKVISQERLSEGIFSLVIKNEGAKFASPGQFVGVYPKSKDTLLMRPISICETDTAEGTTRLVYRVAGKGTSEFSTLNEGDKVKILANLGNGFPVDEVKGKCIVLMGGGIGIPPMLGVAKILKGEDVHSFLGYRNRDMFLSEEFMQYSKVYISTEDGSVGVKGNVIDAAKACTGLKPDVIMACGPMPMLRAIKQYAKDNNIQAYISLEERMACGVGACLGCVCKTVAKDHHSHVNNTRICTEGPVFDAEEVDI
ncbi:MAG: dihydroorotate dehydrogenase electron transfer subunit [Lachnospiraceae bacterium]|nr:dihydroorotate dehydrogenase electron transfer subunit [Lachnospiraceae bacterium]